MDDIAKTFDWFRDDGIFAPMLNDVGRNKFYQDAIAASVQGKIVADIGAGTGLLSFMSCASGAKHVYAIEKNPPRAEYLQQMVNQMSVQNRVTVVAADFLDTDIAADIYISETINTQIFGEDILSLAAHARSQGGKFIPAWFDIWAEVYDYHPIFVLDQSESDASTIQIGVTIQQAYLDKVNADFQHRHPINSTRYVANQLNKLFTLLPRFEDIRLNRVWSGANLRVDLNSEVCLQELKLTIPVHEIPANITECHVVLFWRAGYGDIVMNSNDVWFGNVAKTLEHHYWQRERDIDIWYDADLRNWRLWY